MEYFLTTAQILEADALRQELTAVSATRSDAIQRQDRQRFLDARGRENEIRARLDQLLPAVLEPLR